VFVAEPSDAVNTGVAKYTEGRLRLQSAVWLLSGFCTGTKG